MNVSSDSIVDVNNESPLALNPDNRDPLEHSSDLGELLHALGTASLGRTLISKREDMREQT